MTKIYMISEELQDFEHGDETRVCHNFGAFYLECDAQKRCDQLNKEERKEKPDMEDDRYAVKTISVR